MSVILEWIHTPGLAAFLALKWVLYCVLVVRWMKAGIGLATLRFMLGLIIGAFLVSGGIKLHLSVWTVWAMGFLAGTGLWAGVLWIAKQRPHDWRFGWMLFRLEMTSLVMDGLGSAIVIGMNGPVC